MSDIDIIDSSLPADLPDANLDTQDLFPPPDRVMKPYTVEVHAFLTSVDTHHEALSRSEAEICQEIDSLRNTLNKILERELKAEQIPEPNLRVACEAKFEALEASFRGAFQQMVKFEDEREGACRGTVLRELERAVDVAHRTVWVHVREMADLLKKTRTEEQPAEGYIATIGKVEME